MNKRERTDANVDLAGGNLVRDLVDAGEAGGALAVDGVHGGSVGDACSEGGHTRGRRAAAWGEDIANRNIFDKGGDEADLGVDGAEDLAEDLLGACVLETALLCLTNTF